MAVPLGWTMSAKGNYICMCGRFQTYDLGDVGKHMSTEFEGYCVRGLKAISNRTYKCICGDKFLEPNGWKDERYRAYEHVCIQLEGKEYVCMNRYRNKCKKCNLQLDSPSALKLHYKSKSHINFEMKVDLYCKVCDIKCDCQKEMLAHLATSKHKKRTASIIPATNNEGSEEP
jgi:hypothetical protein